MSVKNDRAARKALVLKMAEAFPGSQSQLTAGLVDSFIEATADCTLEAFRSSVVQFTTGRVEEHDGRFIPSVPQFARNVRLWHQVLEGAKDTGPKLYTGILEVDFGRGRIDMRGLTVEQQEEVFRTKRAPDPDVLRLEDGGPNQVRPARLRKM